MSFHSLILCFEIHRQIGLRPAFLLSASEQIEYEYNEGNCSTFYVLIVFHLISVHIFSLCLYNKNDFKKWDKLYLVNFIVLSNILDVDQSVLLRFDYMGIYSYKCLRAGMGGKEIFLLLIRGRTRVLGTFLWFNLLGDILLFRDITYQCSIT